jgi:hypothetical protein
MRSLTSSTSAHHARCALARGGIGKSLSDRLTGLADGLALKESRYAQGDSPHLLGPPLLASWRELSGFAGILTSASAAFALTDDQPRSIRAISVILGRYAHAGANHPPLDAPQSALAHRKR